MAILYNKLQDLMTKKGRTAFFRYTSVKISIITNTPPATPTPIHLDVLNSDVTCKQTKNRNAVSANPPNVSVHFLVIIFLLYYNAVHFAILRVNLRVPPARTGLNFIRKCIDLSLRVCYNLVVEI